MPDPVATCRTLWSVSLPPTPLLERIRIAADVGFAAVSVSASDVKELDAAGVPLAEARAHAEAAGVALPVMDGCMSWYRFPPPKRPMDYPEPPVDEMIAGAVGIGCTVLNVLAPYATDASLDELAASYGALCDRAAPAGLRVIVEFSPFPPIGSLRRAWEVVRRADRPNGGILLDSWHFFQGEPDLELLASLPPGTIRAVQLSDGHRGRFVASLPKDTFRHRMLPGAGSFPLDELLTALAPAVDPDETLLFGAEVMAEELYALPAAEVAGILARAGG
jgi:sugar phosphate isomerase/epimerase